MTTAGRTGGLTGLSATVSDWVQGHTSLITALAGAAVVLVLALGTLQRRRIRAPRRDETVT